MMEDNMEHEAGPYTRAAQDAQVEGNYILAEKLMLMGVETQEHNALFTMGYFYENALQQHKKAETYYLAATEVGNANAMFNLAAMYEDVVELQDYDKAEAWYLKACAEGEPNAMFNLAMLYSNIKNDYDKAKTYYLKCIAYGDVNAICNLALLYLEVDKNYEEAMLYYNKAIAKGDAGAMYGLAYIFDTIKQDYVQAENWYLKASEYGNEDALNHLPTFYSSTGHDPIKGIEFCKKAHAIDSSVPQILWMLTYLFVLKNDWPQALDNAEQFLSMDSAYYSSDLVTEMLDKLIVSKQYPFLLKLFSGKANAINEFARHYYFVLAWFYKDALPGEYEKADGDIKRYADEVIERLQKEEYA